MNALDAIAGRRSVRAFLPDPVSEDIVRTILEVSTRAASGTNIQPWQVYVVTGETRDRLARAGRAAGEAGDCPGEYEYQPRDIGEPYLARRRKIGYDLYETYGIARDDYPARKQAMLRNYDFFGAPVGLFFCIDRHVGQGAWIDTALFMQNVMIAARAHGLETCPQQAWCDIGPVVHRELGIPDSQMLISGMSLGHEDKSAQVNTLVSTRAQVDEFTTWQG